MTQKVDPWIAALHPQVSDGTTTQPGRPTLVVQGPGAPTIADDAPNKQTVLTFPNATVVTKTVDASSASITKGYGVMQKNGKLTLGTASALSLGLYIAGLVLAAGTANNATQVVTQGLVDPTVINVGAGVACAVGLDANGKPVRVTDPTCVSGLKFVGVCDVNGAIYVTPKNAESHDVRDYGAKLDGTTDDTTAIQAALDRMKVMNFGSVSIVGPALISSTLKLSDVKNLAIKGAAGAALVWNGSSNPAAPIPALWLESCYECDVIDLDVRCPTGKILDEGVRQSTKASRTYISTRNRLTRVHVFGDVDEVTVGFQLGGQGVNANNDFHIFTHCSVQNYRRSAFKSDDSQVYSIVLEACVTQAFAGATTGDMTNGSAILTTPANKFSARDVGGYVEVAGADAGATTLRTTIASITDSTHVVLSTAASTSVTGAVVTYGSSFGYENNAGNFSAFGGGFNGVLGAGVYTTGLNNGGIVLDGLINEGNRCELATSGPSGNGHKRVTLRNCRLAGDAATSFANYISFALAGELVIDSTDVGDFNVTTNPVDILFAHGGGSPEYAQFVFRDSTISSSLPFGNNTGNCFAGYAPTDVAGTCLYAGSGGVEQFDRVPMAFGVGGSVNVDWGYSLTWDVSTTSATLAPTLLHGRVGLGRSHVLRILNNTAGAMTITWPGSVNWGAAGAPADPASGKYIIVEFLFDGTTYFGRLVGTGY